MIPIHKIRENLEEYTNGARKKNISVDFSRLLKLDEALRTSQYQQQILRSIRNKLADNVAKFTKVKSSLTGLVKSMESHSQSIAQLSQDLAGLDLQIQLVESLASLTASIAQLSQDLPAQLSESLASLTASFTAIEQAVDQLAVRPQLVESLRFLAHSLESTKGDMVRCGGCLKQEIAGLDAQVRNQQRDLRELHLRIPQPPKASVPVGHSDQDNVELKVVGSESLASSRLLSHQELGERLNLIDFKQAVKLSGARSYVLTGLGALLEQAILRLAYDHCQAQNYTAMSVPVLVNEACMEGTGYFPGGKDQSYQCEQDNLCLVGTGEVPVCAFYMDQILAADDLPLKLFTQTSCFRREAGSYGKDTKGLYRVHQFQKVEQVIIGASCEELSEQYHAELMSNSEQIMAQLELPYRVVEVCTGDLGGGAYYKYDIEAWMPSRRSYGETHSCSAFLEYQSRRLRLRYKDQTGGVHYCHTLNNTAIASPRILIPFLEIHQVAGGNDILIPQSLRPYLGGACRLSEIS